MEEAWFRLCYLSQTRFDFEMAWGDEKRGRGEEGLYRRKDEGWEKRSNFEIVIHSPKTTTSIMAVDPLLTFAFFFGLLSQN